MAVTGPRTVGCHREVVDDALIVGVRVTAVLGDDESAIGTEGHSGRRLDLATEEGGMPVQDAGPGPPEHRRVSGIDHPSGLHQLSHPVGVIGFQHPGRHCAIVRTRILTDRPATNRWPRRGGDPHSWEELPGTRR